MKLVIVLDLFLLQLMGN